MKFKRIVSGSMCGLLLASASMAQESGQGKTDPAQKSQTQQNPTSHANAAHSTQHMIGTCLVLDNQEEVLLSKFAVEKCQNKEVAAFAKKLIEAHSKCLADLNKIDPSLDKHQLLADQAGPNSDRSTTKAQTVSNSNPTKSDAKNTDSTGGNNDMTQMQVELAQQCLADSQAMLTRDGGKHFDECFVGLQIAKHGAMQSKLTVFQRHATGELKEAITKGLAMTKDHLAQAESLMKTLDNDNDDDKSDRKSK